MNESVSQNVRKLIAALVILVFSLSMVGCSFKRQHRLPGKGETEIIENQLEIFIDAIEDEDVDAIIDMFSEDALDDIDEDELEESIEELIATFPDWDGNYDKLKVREYRRHLYSDSYYIYEPDFWFTADGVEYELHFVMVYKAYDEKLVGLSVIQINHDDISGYTTPGYYCRPDYDTTPGVYCWDCKID